MKLSCSESQENGLRIHFLLFGKMKMGEPSGQIKVRHTPGFSGLVASIETGLRQDLELHFNGEMLLIDVSIESVAVVDRAMGFWRILCRWQSPLENGAVGNLAELLRANAIGPEATRESFSIVGTPGAEWNRVEIHLRAENLAACRAT